MRGRDAFIEEFESMWPAWKGDMELYIQWVEKTRKPMSVTRYFSMTYSGDAIKAELYKGGAVESFGWPLPDGAGFREASR